MSMGQRNWMINEIATESIIIWDFLGIKSEHHPKFTIIEMLTYVQYILFPGPKIPSSMEASFVLFLTNKIHPHF